MSASPSWRLAAWDTEACFRPVRVSKARVRQSNMSSRTPSLPLSPSLWDFQRYVPLDDHPRVAPANKKTKKKKRPHKTIPRSCQERTLCISVCTMAAMRALSRSDLLIAALCDMQGCNSSSQFKTKRSSLGRCLISVGFAGLKSSGTFDIAAQAADLVMLNTCVAFLQHFSV